MPRADRPSSGRMPGLLVSLRQDGSGLFSWRTTDWDALTPRDLAGLGEDPTVARQLQRWTELEAEARPLLPAHPMQGTLTAWVVVVHEDGAAGQATLAMLQEAAAAHPGLPLVVVVDGWMGRGTADSLTRLPRIWRRGGLAARIAACIPPSCARGPWLRGAAAVYTHGSVAGMEALLAGCPAVHVWGWPFYAGWGLTQDRARSPSHAAAHAGQHAHPPASPAERGPATLAALFEATACRRSAYADLARQGHGSLDQVLDALDHQRAVRQRFAAWGPIEARGMARWKRPFLAPYLQAGGHAMRWQPRAHGRPTDAKTVALWGATPVPPGEHRPVVRVEDGFLRSVGLGSDLIAPCSLVLDNEGIYFDASAGSALLARLGAQAVTPAQCRRAAALRAEIVRQGVSKYNFSPRAVDWTPPKGRRVLLAIGQVADDAAMRLGTGLGTDDVRTAEALLARMRALQPQAYIVYKPHPDVLSGNRRGLTDARPLCDRVDAEADLLSLIDMAHEVHVISSLVGFDALLRGKPVHTHGRPFFAGWGLTTDHSPSVPSRPRNRSLDELVALALLDYPLYWDWEWGIFTDAETTVRSLASRMGAERLPGPRPSLRRTLTKTRRWMRNLLDAWV